MMKWSGLRRGFCCAVITGTLLAVPVCVQAKNLFDFEGRLDLPGKKISLSVDPGDNKILTFSLEKKSDKNYSLTINTDHLKTPLFMISTVLESSLEILTSSSGSQPIIQGSLVNHYTLINQRPIQALQGRFIIRDGYWIWDSMVIGGVSVKGYIGFTDPYPVDLKLFLTEMPLSDFISFFSGDEEVFAHGSVSGEVRVTGVLDRMVLRAHLTSENGGVASWRFRNMSVNLEGVYPNVYVRDSFVINSDDMISSISGGVDLSDKKNLAHQIKALSLLPITRSEAMQQEWTLKRIEDENKKGATELKYLFRKNENTSGMDDSASDFLGVEHKIEF